MKKNTKGFTLIELLAVIVILAVIALIATPIIMGVISDAKTKANKDSAYGYAKAIEQAIALQLTETPDMKVGAITITSGTTEVACTNCGTGKTKFGVTYKGTKPDATDLVFDQLTGKFTAGKGVTYSGDTFNINENGEFVKK